MFMTLILIIMVGAIVFFHLDNLKFFRDLEKVAKGKKTEKYFTEFNKPKK